MPRIARREAAKQISHVINRGVEKRAIFLRAEDYAFFLAQTREVFSAFGISLLSYCLMPNHYHLLTAMTTAGLSAAMQSLQSRYSMYFNRVYQRVGHLFQDRFKSFEVDDMDYLAWLPVYIHMNPVRARLALSPHTWEWSSHAEISAAGAVRYLDLPRLQDFGVSPDGFKRRYLREYEAFSRPLPKEARLTEILRWSAAASGIRWQDIVDGARGTPFTRARLLMVQQAQARGYTVMDAAEVLGCSQSALRHLLAGAAQEKGHTL
jgi:putative transposase